MKTNVTNFVKFRGSGARSGPPWRKTVLFVPGSTATIFSNLIYIVILYHITFYIVHGLSGEHWQL